MTTTQTTIALPAGRADDAAPRCDDDAASVDAARVEASVSALHRRIRCMVAAGDGRARAVVELAVAVTATADAARAAGGV